ncbi:TRAP dicarboxylate transporter, DctM subunit [Desulfonatronospira thiodismutans ASO3-1]|uniref:TRAP dicarboxylate transporter, DctM subunit n=1 Tax=Desulfonatronospira thiodismutans ASO3-1 TaxID=555779 RepID=D6SKH3_9BACT|nr:TRAP transporter large permease [Desulfonatronospira thiodismutans]EFI36376.1 TRAP dicarboxylate transporter, DctM subunit [Desulfonatronospira thiodismutans ASO3-1]
MEVSIFTLEISILTMVLLSLGAMFLLGMPVFMSLAVASALALSYGGYLPMSVIHNTMFDGLNIFPLLAIPCFVIAGTLMEYGNITKQIVDVVKQLVGRMYGGLGLTTIVACTFFAAISGSGPGTVAAVGTILVPAMIRTGYSKDYAASVASSGGTIGLLIPPSNPMIIYAILGNVSVTAMFTAGFLPGFIVGFSMCMTAWLIARQKGFGRSEELPPFNLRHFLLSCVKGFFSLITPIIILGSIYTGLATPVEASVLAIAWALFVGFLINRALTLSAVYKSLLEGSLICGAVLLIVGTSTLFGRILTFEEAPQLLAEMALSVSENPYIILLMIVGVLLILGMFMETLSTIIILVPVFMPMIHIIGIDPVHFGIILVLTNQIALSTPPLGVNLFVASRISKVSVERISIGVLPYIIAMLICTLLIVFFPKISTILPELILGYGR